MTYQSTGKIRGFKEKNGNVTDEMVDKATQNRGKRQQSLHYLI